MKSPMKFMSKSVENVVQQDGTWKVLIVDDEQSVHTITTTVLEGIVFDEKKLEFISAYSGEEAKKIIEKNSDIALVLLDVVMENDSAGLEFVDYVRKELKNSFVRIVLRTGQPGHAPQKDVIDGYDINDYKEKTDLTAQKLYTTVIASLRNYKELKQLDSEKVEISAPKNSNAIYEFSQNSLNKLIKTIVEFDGHSSQDEFHALIVGTIKGEQKLLAKTKEFDNLNFEDILLANEDIAQVVEKSMKTKSSFTFSSGVVNYYEDESGNEHLIYISCNKSLSQNDIYTIEMFAFNFSSAIELYYR